mmetsp:Transcript_7928/g.15399  ORF Transcript_7928/g.15399 Transcript_7928/m.15399 type:complete len:258 (-) Transcript_7928:1310-2083(-)
MGAHTFTIVWCTAGLYFVNWPLREPFKDHTYLPDVMWYSFFLIWLLAMSSYVVGFFSSPGRGYKYELLNDGGKCNQCDLKRPRRTHHCRVCGRCTLRMDHHCVWLKNCVGLRNYKPFFLFVWYYWFGCLFHNSLFLYYFFMQPTEYIETWPTWIWFYVHCFLCCFFFAFVTILLKMQMGYLYYNSTTLECLSNTPFCYLPPADPDSKYNLGAVANFVSIFGSNPLWWWLPVPTYDWRLEARFDEVECREDVEELAKQ